MHRVTLILVLTTLALTSCGSDRARPRADASGTVSGTPSATASLEAAAREARIRASGAISGSKSTPEPSPLPSGPARENTMPLTVSLNRTCARVGDEMRAEAVTEKGTKLAFAAAYSDNSLVPDFTYVPGDANPTGSFTWRWVIRPDISPGDAILTVVASKDRRGASFNQPFRIATSC